MHIKLSKPPVKSCWLIDIGSSGMLPGFVLVLVLPVTGEAGSTWPGIISEMFNQRSSLAGWHSILIEHRSVHVLHQYTPAVPTLVHRCVPSHLHGCYCPPNPALSVPPAENILLITIDRPPVFPRSSSPQCGWMAGWLADYLTDPIIEIVCHSHAKLIMPCL